MEQQHGWERAHMISVPEEQRALPRLGVCIVHAAGPTRITDTGRSFFSGYGMKKSFQACLRIISPVSESVWGTKTLAALG